jgi:hypothetical protein
VLFSLIGELDIVAATIAESRTFTLVALGSSTVPSGDKSEFVQFPKAAWQPPPQCALVEPQKLLALQQSPNDESLHL